MPPKSKKPAPQPAATKKAQPPPKAANPLFEKKPKGFGIGNNGTLSIRRPLNRYVKWPLYVRVQRQRRILMKRLKVPPALNQFSKTLDRNLSKNLFKLLQKYRPENGATKKERLAAKAVAENQGKTLESKKPVVVKYGINHVAWLVEQGKAQLVAIACDVDPIEIVVWLPALCRKMGVPYCIVKDKATLGMIVHKKTATAVALTNVKNEDKMEFSKLVESLKSSYNDRYEDFRKHWGGSIMGVKSQAETRKREMMIEKENAKRLSA